MEYAELQITSNFSFLRGGSHPKELVEAAVILGYKAIAITDYNKLAGIVRAHKATKGKDIRLIPACRLELLDGYPLLAYPIGKDGYSSLSSLLTKGNMRAEKGQCHLYKSDVYAHAKDIKFITLPPSELNSNFEFEPEYTSILVEYKKALGNNLYLGASFLYSGDDQKKLSRLSQLENKLQIPMVAINDVHYHIPERRQLQDVLTCIREKCTIQYAGFRVHANAERYLKPIDEMHRLFRQHRRRLRARKTRRDHAVCI